MDLIRDLLRDLVGIIFPGGLFVILTLWLIFCLAIVLFSFNINSIFVIGDKSISFLILLIFSYIAGQSLRIRQLEHLEKACTETYRKKRMKAHPGLSEDEFQESIRSIDQLEEDFYAGKTTQDKLVEAYKQHNNRLFQIGLPFEVDYSWGIVMLSALGLAAIWYLNREILERLRFMRTKELNLAFDGFFVICRRHNLEIR
jgi:hypothetical protein